MANLYVLHQGQSNNGQLWISSYDGANWSQGGIPNVGMSDSPGAVDWAGNITVFHQGQSNNGQLWYAYSSNGTYWPGDNFVQNIGMSGSPSAVVYKDHLYVFHQGQENDGHLWYTVYDGANWSLDTPIPNVGMSGSPSAVLYAGGISVFHQGQENDGNLWYTYYDGANWGGDAQVPNFFDPPAPIMSGSPSAVVYNSLLYVFHQGRFNNGQLLYAVYNGTNWSLDTQIPNLGMSESPSAVLWHEGISVFHQGQSNNGQLWYTFSPDGNRWGTTQTDARVPGVGMSGSPSCVVF
jgi:hypothetical protein